MSGSNCSFQIDLNGAVKSWFEYLNIKKETRVDLPGIYPKLYGGKYPYETVKFSLVPNVAPELSGLGNLCPASRPHVYLEGILDESTKLPFSEADFSVLDEEFIRYFPQNKKSLDFLFYLYSFDGHYGGERFIKKSRKKELVFLREGNEIFGFNFQVDSANFVPFHFELSRKFSFEDVSQRDLKIIESGFSSAIKYLGE